jgi:hypothetical protein
LKNIPEPLSIRRNVKNTKLNQDATDSNTKLAKDVLKTMEQNVPLAEKIGKVNCVALIT